METKDNIHDEPENIPNLNRSGNKNPFNSGGDYFDEFSKRLQTRIDHHEEIKNHAPLLLDIPKYNPFIVPSGYFDDLPTLVQNKIISKPKSSVIEWFTLLLKPRVIFPIAITLFIAFAGIKYISNNAVQPIAPIAEEITVDEQLQTIDETTIIDELTAQTQNSYAVESDDGIVNYLIENDIDETNFNNEL